MSNIIMSCESTIDLPYSYSKERNISIIHYSYVIDDIEYVDDMGRNPESLNNFYNAINEGKLPKTSQINYFYYYNYFEKLIKKGDVLHIAFGSGMTPSIKNANKAAEDIKKKYPDRKLIVIDSFSSSSGYGLLVDSALDLRDNGASIEEIAKWTRDNAKNVHHQFFSTDLSHFRRSGRVSGPTAMIATILGICPIMHLDNPGHIISYSKARGKKRAILTTIQEMEKNALDGINYSGKCFISHSNCYEDALNVKEKILEHFPNINKDIKINNIGTIIASHSGPGTIAVFFFGHERH